ncbi:histidine kinase [Streptomyces sp. MP131-18]|uniref:sensor histidine kinase n=1 Tax=Streptomyces sp. MP131-18 TaxID=1857892 RepID=UPI0009A23C0B|nr:histidine kinase [Streptomyces sp. MP131-18]ONK11847.1 Sensor histidine kinase DesK [Streptomyces sp. MP131-18]
MKRHFPAAAVIAADTAIVAGAWQPWAVLVFALAVGAVTVLGTRLPVPALMAALLLASLTGVAFLVLLWSAYRAGAVLVSRTDGAVTAGAVAGSLAAQLVARADGPGALPQLISGYVAFVALPLLTGRYLAQQRRLVTALDERNRQLTLERELLAERERLRERLRIARDMHDSLGHRLSLVSVQAAALEVSDLPPRERKTAAHVAVAARAAMSELHELVGALRGEEEAVRAQSLGVAAIETLTEEFRTAGLAVEFRQRGEPRQLSAAAWQAAYRVAEEGLTNAVKHAPGAPVRVGVAWEGDALLLTVVNPVGVAPDAAAAGRQPPGGHGLTGLGERVTAVGGFLDHRRTDGAFRLVAMLPDARARPGSTESPGSPGSAGGTEGSGGSGSGGARVRVLAPVGAGPGEEEGVGSEAVDPGRVRAMLRTAGLGVAMATLIFFFLPAGMLMGVR